MMTSTTTDRKSAAIAAVNALQAYELEHAAEVTASSAIGAEWITGIRDDVAEALDYCDAATREGSSVFDDMTRREDWYGFGYLGERAHALIDGRMELVRQADAYVLMRAKQLRWGPVKLFRWANSKNGRWFGVAAFGSDEPVIADRFLMAERWGVMRQPVGTQPVTAYCADCKRLIERDEWTGAWQHVRLDHTNADYHAAVEE